MMTLDRAGGAIQLHGGKMAAHLQLGITPPGASAASFWAKGAAHVREMSSRGPSRIAEEDEGSFRPPASAAGNGTAKPMNSSSASAWDSRKHSEEWGNSLMAEIPGGVPGRLSKTSSAPPWQPPTPLTAHLKSLDSNVDKAAVIPTTMSTYQGQSSLGAHLQSSLLQKAKQLRALGMEVENGISVRRKRQKQRIATQRSIMEEGSILDDANGMGSLGLVGDAKALPGEATSRTRRGVEGRETSSTSETSDVSTDGPLMGKKKRQSSLEVRQAAKEVSLKDGRVDVLASPSALTAPEKELSKTKLNEMIALASAESRNLEVQLLESLPWTTLREVAAVVGALASARRELTPGRPQGGADIR